MFGVEQDLPYFFADSGIAWVSKTLDRNALILQPFGQEFCLRTLSAAVRPIKNYKFACKFVF
jgi:hypothetical protein